MHDVQLLILGGKLKQWTHDYADAFCNTLSLVSLKAFFCVEPQVLSEVGEVLEGEASGVLVLARSWPGQ